MRFAPTVGFVVLFLMAGSSVSLADIHYYPTDGTLATWAFEDNWSKKGDFDFNDVVIRYNMRFTTTLYDEATVVTEAKFRLQLVARGAQFKSGFAISLPISRTGVTATLGCENAEALPVPDGDPDNTVYVVIPDVSAVLDGGCAFYNTEDPNCGGDGTEFTLTVTIPPENGVNGASLGMGVNPFIFRVGEEGREVHLAGFEPSATAILSSIGLFRTEDDDTECTPASGTCTALTGHYYLTANDLPWALDIPTEWIWPLEQVDVTSAYLDFGSWAASFGRDDGAWFTSLGEAGTTWTDPVNVNGQCQETCCDPGCVILNETQRLAIEACTDVVGYLAVSGDYWSGPGITGFALPNLVTIGGDLTLGAGAIGGYTEELFYTNADPFTFSLPGLKTIGGALEMQQLGVAVAASFDLSLPNLESVGGYVVFGDYAYETTTIEGLRSISMPKLTSLGGGTGLYLKMLAGLVPGGLHLDLSSLETINGGFWGNDVTGLVNPNLSSLALITQDMQFINVDGMESLDLSSLSEISSTLVIQGCDGLTYLQLGPEPNPDPDPVSWTIGALSGIISNNDDLCFEIRPLVAATGATFEYFNSETCCPSGTGTVDMAVDPLNCGQCGYSCSSESLRPYCCNGACQKDPCPGAR